MPVQGLGAPLAMLTDTVSYLGSVVFLRRIGSPEPPIEPEPGAIRGQLVAGLGLVLRDPIIRPSMLAVTTVNLFSFFVVTIAACLGVLWMVGSPVLRLRDLPDAAS